jgi:hypothetical protein
MVGLTELLQLKIARRPVDYGRSALAFQTIK